MRTCNWLTVSMVCDGLWAVVLRMVKCKLVCIQVFPVWVDPDILQPGWAAPAAQRSLVCLGVFPTIRYWVCRRLRPRFT